MELTPTIQLLHEATRRLSKASSEVFRLAKAKAESEREYRMALGREIFILRDEKMPATLIPDTARSRVADLKFERDLAADTYRAAISAMKSLEVEVSALQSIIRYQQDI